MNMKFLHLPFGIFLRLSLGVLAGAAFMVVFHLPATWADDQSGVAPALTFGDTDGDEIPDHWEVENGGNKDDLSDAASDFDNDGLTTLQEF